MNLEDIYMKISDDRLNIETSEIFPRMLLCLPDMSGIQEGYEDLAFWPSPQSPSTITQRNGKISTGFFKSKSH